MMKVYDWMGSKKGPENPTIEDMRYGIGCMNELTIITADLFKDLVIKIEGSRYKGRDPVEMLEEMDMDTLGRLWGRFKSDYSGKLIKPSKVVKAIKERNFFIHGYHNDHPTKEEGARLFIAICSLKTVNNQLTAVQNKINKEIKVNQNVENDALRKTIIELVHSCNQFEDGHVYLTELGNALKQNGYKFGRLSKVISGFHWEMYYNAGHETLLFLKVEEIY